MKKNILFWIAVVCLVGSCYLIYKKYQNSLKLEETMTTMRIEKPITDIGDRKLNTPAVGKFKIYNSGVNDLLIKNVVPECHCTVGEFADQPIKPGDSATIFLRYDSSRMGGFQSTARLETNSEQSPVLLVLRGNMIPIAKPK